jgi:hypothetical protein
MEAGSAGEFASGGAGVDFNAHLWAPGGNHYTDVLQHGSPTCVFLAALSGVAATNANLAQRITYAGNSVYRVKLYRPGTGWVTREVHFDGTYKTAGPGPAWDGSFVWYDPVPRDAGQSADFWTILYQRAYRDELAARDELDERSFDYEIALNALTGRTPHSGNWDPEQLHKILATGGTVIACQADDTPLTVPGHCYTVLDVFQASGGWWVMLRNPWGVDNEADQPDDGFDDGILVVHWDDFHGSTYDFDRLYYVT